MPAPIFCFPLLFLCFPFIQCTRYREAAAVNLIFQFRRRVFASQRAAVRHVVTRSRVPTSNARSAATPSPTPSVHHHSATTTRNKTVCYCKQIARQHSYRNIFGRDRRRNRSSKNFTLLQFHYHAKFGGSVSYGLPVCRSFQKLRVGSRPVGIRGVPDLYKHVPPPYVPNLVAPGQTVREYIRRSTGKNWPPASRFSRSLKVKNRLDAYNFLLVTQSSLTMAITRTVSEIKGEFGRKSQIILQYISVRLTHIPVAGGDFFLLLSLHSRYSVQLN